jgi:hypothetical protein
LKSGPQWPVFLFLPAFDTHIESVAFDKDTLEEISGFPQSSIGASIPVALGDEHTLFLCYYIENTETDWDGTTTKLVGADTPDEPLPSFSLISTQPINPDRPTKRPLAVIPYTRKASTLTASIECTILRGSFECIANGMTFEIEPGSLRRIVSALVGKL